MVLKLPLVAVGLFYKHGYFQQSLTLAGDQVSGDVDNDPRDLPLEQVLDADGKPVHVDIQMPSSHVILRVWKVAVGRVSLYLLDSNVPENRPEDREITARLYGGDQDMRVRQEVLLGIGGMKALKALAYKPTVCHMNEGHSAFLSLERIRELIEEEKLTFAGDDDLRLLGRVDMLAEPLAGRHREVDRRRLFGIATTVREEPADPCHFIAGTGSKFGRLQIGDVRYFHRAPWLVFRRAPRRIVGDAAGRRSTCQPAWTLG